MNLRDLSFPLVGERVRLESSPGGANIIRIADGETVGRFGLEAEGNALTIRALCVDEQHRSYGAGSEAARLLNQACDAARVPLIRSWAPPDRGLAAYFWIRMGYRPLHGEGPQGGLWFERRR